MFEITNKLEYDLGKLVQASQMLVTFSNNIHGNKSVERDMACELERLVRNMSGNHELRCMEVGEMLTFAKVFIALGDGYVPE